MIILIKYCADMKYCESFRGVYIYNDDDDNNNK